MWGGGRRGAGRGKEVAGWLQGVRFGRCGGGGRVCVCGDVVLNPILLLCSSVCLCQINHQALPMACFLPVFHRQKLTPTLSVFHLHWAATATLQSGNKSAEQKTLLLPWCPRDGSAMAWPDKLATDVTDVFHPDLCVCVRVYIRQACHCADYVLCIRQLPWMDGCKALICFNLDDACWSVPWAPVTSHARPTNKSILCRYNTLN